MRSTTWVLTVVVGAWLPAGSRVAVAQPEPGTDGVFRPMAAADREREAADRFRAGNAAWEAGCQQAAYGLYREAVVLVAPADHPELMGNLAVALTRMGYPEAGSFADDLRIAATDPKAPSTMLSPASPEIARAPVPAPEAEPRDPAASTAAVGDAPAFPAPAEDVASAKPDTREFRWSDVFESHIGSWHGWAAKLLVYAAVICAILVGCLLCSEDAALVGWVAFGLAGCLFWVGTRFL